MRSIRPCTCATLCYTVKVQMILTFKSMDKMLKGCYLNESYWAVLSFGTVYQYAVWFSLFSPIVGEILKSSSMSVVCLYVEIRQNKLFFSFCDKMFSSLLDSS